MAVGIDVEYGSENLWADIGRADADEALARAELMGRVTDVLRGKGLSARAAAEALGIDDPTAAALFAGEMSRFTLVRLTGFIDILEPDCSAD